MIESIRGIGPKEKEIPFRFSEVFPGAKTQSDHIQTIRNLNDDTITKLYTEGIRLESLDSKLEKQVAKNHLDSTEVENAHKIINDKHAFDERKSNDFLKEYYRAQKFKHLFGWTLGLSLPTFLCFVGYIVYIRRKERNAEKQLQDVLKAASQQQDGT
jgi:hypothetical protein